MKICILTQNVTKNDDRLYYKLGKSLAEIGEVYIINPIFPNIDNNPKHIGIEKNITHRQERMQWYVNQLNILKPDVVIANHPYFLSLATFYKKQNKTKVIYDPAEDWVNMVKELSSSFWIKNWIVSQYIKWTEWVNSKDIDLVITTDNWLESFYCKKFKTLQLFNYPNLSIFNDYISKRNNQSLVYHGQLIKERGIFDLIHAISLLKNNFPKITLNLIGWFTKNEEEIEAKQLTEKLNITKHVNFISSVEHTKISKVISSNSVGIVPLQNIRKFQHNIPTKVFEYAACGMHIVSSNLPPTQQLTNSEKWCSFYEAGNIDSLVNVISNVLKNSTNVNSEGRKMFETKFNWESQEILLLETIKRLVQNV
jgi:glycosyltransferase involved in cell wall biosynthesis